MINELETLEERIAEQERTIQYLGDYIDKLVMNKDKIHGLIRAYDRGDMTGTMLVSQLRTYVK